jgi:hypothetical protein
MDRSESLLAPKSSIASWYIVANKDRTVQTATLRREPDGRTLISNRRAL